MLDIQIIPYSFNFFLSLNIFMVKVPIKKKKSLAGAALCKERPKSKKGTGLRGNMPEHQHEETRTL